MMVIRNRVRQETLQGRVDEMVGLKMGKSFRTTYQTEKDYEKER